MNDESDIRMMDPDILDREDKIMHKRIDNALKLIFDDLADGHLRKKEYRYFVSTDLSSVFIDSVSDFYSSQEIKRIIPGKKSIDEFIRTLEEPLRRYVDSLLVYYADLDVVSEDEFYQVISNNVLEFIENSIDEQDEYMIDSKLIDDTNGKLKIIEK